MLNFLKYLFILLICFNSGCRDSSSDVISIFPLKKYNQEVSNWIPSSDPNFMTPVMSSDIQKKRFLIFYNHYFGTMSPWHSDYVNKVLYGDNPNFLKLNELELLKEFSNKNKTKKERGYSENFRPYPQTWINEIATNMNVPQFENVHYLAKNRAIAIDNLFARALPTDDEYYYHYTIPGQGYPFDNLQISAIWAGSPLYILGETQDHAWSLILSPDFIGWVKSSGIARVDEQFIKTWVKSAIKHFVAITQTKTSVIDINGVYRFSAYVGAVFPGEETKEKIKILIPIADEKQKAKITYAFISKQAGTIMPFTPNRANFSKIMQTLLGRPYGWGNKYFYNDCSGELKNFFTPFGIWLPRHSSEQVNAGKMIDLSNQSPEERLKYIMTQGHPFTTIIYIKGHILLYIGNYPNPNSKNHELMAMSFQNKWGLKPDPAIRRAVIGKSVLFPLLKQFPEDPRLVSQLADKYFLVSHLDEIPDLPSLSHSAFQWEKD